MSKLDKQYLIEKAQSDSPEDLIGKFLFKLIQISNAGNQGLNGLNDRQSARHREITERIDEGLKMNREEQILLAGIKKTIEEKNIDLSGIEEVLSHILSSNLALGEALDRLGEQHPKTLSELAGIAEILRQNKPQNKDIVASQDKMAERIGNLLVELTKEVKSKGFPKEIKISGPVEIVKPGWWKPFEFSWEPLKELVEKIKTHTFSVKVINPQEKEDPLNIDDLAKKIGLEVEKAIKKIPRSGGMGNPFSFDESGNLKIASPDIPQYDLYITYNVDGSVNQKIWKNSETTIKTLTYNYIDGILVSKILS